MHQGDEQRGTHSREAQEGRTDRVTLHREREAEYERAAHADQRDSTAHPHPAGPDPASPGHSAHTHVEPAAIVVGKINQGLVYLLGLIEGLLGLRLLFRAIAANPASPITQFIYGLTEPFLEPFRGLVSNPSFNGHALELTTIIAMAIYFLFFLAIVNLLRLIVSPPRL